MFDAEVAMFLAYDLSNALTLFGSFFIPYISEYYGAFCQSLLECVLKALVLVKSGRHEKRFK